MLIIAHRGYSAAYPDNTRTAFAKALAVGVDYIETDLRLSRDGVIVCHHDAALSVDGTVLAVDGADLRALRRVHPGLMTLAELVELCDHHAGLVLDVKIPTPSMLDDVLAEMTRLAMWDDCILGLRNLWQLDYLRAQRREIPVLGLISSNFEVPLFIEKGARSIRLWEYELEFHLQKNIQRAGCEVWVTAGKPGASAGDIDAPRAKRLCKAGIDGLILNDPGLVAKGV